jgi:CheY-like chemotaxis protein
LRHVAEQAITLAFNEIKYRARLVKDLGPVPMVLGSDGKLAQVFLNLLINAAHAIGEGHVEENQIQVRTWAEGDHVFAEVSDTGQGIAPEHQARVFEPFFTTKGVGVGTGLGLSICKNIVSGFGGEISFSSEIGKGTRFLIRLPRVSDAWESRDQGAREQAPVRAGILGRILVVDDEAGIRGAFVRLLGRDHEVVAVSSGVEAQALLAEDRRFDLIFCDLMMPRMSGMELHAWLAGCDPGLAEQVVFVTGGAFTPGAAEYLRTVGNLRMEKPFDAATFRKAAEELIRAARAKRGG